MQEHGVPKLAIEVSDFRVTTFPRLEIGTKMIIRQYPMTTETNVKTSTSTGTNIGTKIKPT